MSAYKSQTFQTLVRPYDRARPFDGSDRRAFRAIGLVLLLVSLLVTLAYAANFDVAAYTTFRADLATVQGTVTAVEPTDWYEPGTKWSRRDDRTRIVAVRYTFADPTGVQRQGVSYLPGARTSEGTRVTIEYPTERPEVSRIRGYRSAEIDRLPPALYIMAGAGLVLLMVGLFFPVGRGPRAARQDD